MYREELNEEDIFVANKKFILTACAKYGRYLLYEDRYMTACEGFLLAIRKYNRAVHQFHDFAEFCMRIYLEREKRRMNRQRRIESSFSLNRSVNPDSRTCVGDLFFSEPKAIYEDLELSDFLQSLPGVHRRTADLLMNNYSSSEIYEEIKIDPEQLQDIKKDLQQFWLDFQI